jgi:hypothetical protein
MKSLSAVMLYLAMTAFTALCAPAQDREVRVTVPFNFTIGNQTVPAGNYIVSSRSESPDLVHIRSLEKKVHLMTLGRPEHDPKQHTNALVFHKYGGEYFLSDIRTGNSSMNFHFPVSKAERRALTQRDEAGLFPNDPVLVALN